jgi:peptidoglycan/LPS O-acetylase OafA/YrhL
MNVIQKTHLAEKDTAAGTRNPPSVQIGGGFRSDIEGLRAIAVLSVVGFHYGVPGLKGGFIGVDVFFVISGYLITGLLVNENSKTGTIDLLKFYGRRARRLLPAALLVTIFTLGLGYKVLSPIEQKSMAKAAIASSSYLSNVWFLQQSLDYFSPESSLNPFLHTWSLSVEEQFYIVWPTLLLFAAGRGFKFLQLAIALVTIISFALCLYLTHANANWAFYLSPPRAWEFGIGGIASLSSIQPWAQESKAGAIGGWIALGILGAALFVIDERLAFPGYVAMVPVLSAAFVLVSGQNKSGPLLLLRTKPLQFFGLRSYSIYLWHWPILVLGPATFAFPVAPNIFLFFVSVVLASLSFKYLEHPIRSSLWFGVPKRSAAFGLILTLCGVGLGTAAYVNAGWSFSPSQTALLKSTAKVAIANEKGCLVKFRDSTPIRCTFGSSDYVRTLVLFGDSHAEQWSTALAELAARRKWRIITYLKASCAISDIPVYSARLRRFMSECATWRREVIARIASEHPDVVVVTQFSSGYIKGGLTNLGDNAVDLPTWERGLSQTLADLQSANAPLMLLRDNPTPYQPVGNCLARAEWRGFSQEECGKYRKAAINEEVTVAEREAVSAFQNTTFVDFTSLLCREDRCPAIRDGVVVYRDANHLTVDLTLQLIDGFGKILTNVMNAKH